MLNYWRKTSVFSVSECMYTSSGAIFFKSYKQFSRLNFGNFYSRYVIYHVINHAKQLKF